MTIHAPMTIHRIHQVHTLSSAYLDGWRTWIHWNTYQRAAWILMVTSSLCTLHASTYTSRCYIHTCTRLYAWRKSRSISACRLIESNEPVPRERRLNPPVTERLNDSVVSRAVNFSKEKKQSQTQPRRDGPCTSFNNFTQRWICVSVRRKRSRADHLVNYYNST